MMCEEQRSLASAPESQGKCNEIFIERSGEKMVEGEEFPTEFAPGLCGKPFRWLGFGRKANSDMDIERNTIIVCKFAVRLV